MYRLYKYSILLIGKSCKTTSFSEKLTIKMTSCNDRNKKVRQGGKKSGQILGKNPGRTEKQPGKPVRQVVRISTSDTREKSQKAKFQWEAYDQEN